MQIADAFGNNGGLACVNEQKHQRPRQQPDAGCNKEAEGHGGQDRIF